MNMRTPIIAGNWKMNKTPEEAKALINELKPLVADAKAEVVVCPPFVCLPAAVEAAKGSNIKVGAQNVHFKASGAYTAEVSVDMLKALGIEYVIVGHSERRQYFGETDKVVNLRALAALEGGIIPIICVGELLEEREAGITHAVVELQTRLVLANMTKEQASACVIAYEPVWAIGTGKTATAEDAEEVIGFIRSVVNDMYGSEVSEAIRIQYGGSMKPDNATELMAMPNIDGGLIGGASLKAADFSKVVNY